MSVTTYKVQHIDGFQGALSGPLSTVYAMTAQAIQPPGHSGDQGGVEAALSIGLSFRDLLKTANKFFSIPLSQRDYQWEEESVDLLIADIGTLAEKWHNYVMTLSPAHLEELDFKEFIPPHYHSCGAITLRPTTKRHKHVAERQVWDIIDGQQRLTTLTLIAAAYNDMLEEQGLLEEDTTGSPDSSSKDTWLQKYAKAPPLERDDKAFKVNFLVAKGDGEKSHPVLYRDEFARPNSDQDDLDLVVSQEFVGREKPEPSNNVAANVQVVGMYAHAKSVLKGMFPKPPKPGEESPDAEDDKESLRVTSYGFEMFGAALQFGMRFGVVVEHSPDVIDALEKFIVLNTAGKSLRQIDILKTALMKTATEEDASVDGEATIQNMFRAVEKDQLPGDIDRRLRMWFNALVLDSTSTKPVKQMDLVKTIRGYLEAHEKDFKGLSKGNKEADLKALRFMEGLSEGLDTIKDLLRWGHMDSKQQEVRDIIEPLGIKDSFASIALALMLHSDFEDKAYEVARGQALRVLLGIGTFSSSFESTQHTLVQKLRDQKLDVAAVRKLVESQMIGSSKPSLSDAQSRLLTLNYKSHDKKLKTLLLIVERYIKDVAGFAQDRETNTGSKRGRGPGANVSLEHIHPQKYASCTCDSEDAHDHLECWGSDENPLSTVHCLGNLSLLTVSVNSAVNDKDLAAKIDNKAGEVDYASEGQTYLLTKAFVKGGSILDGGVAAKRLPDFEKVKGILEKARVTLDENGKPEWTPKAAHKRGEALAELFLLAVEYDQAPTRNHTKVFARVKRNQNSAPEVNSPRGTAARVDSPRGIVEFELHHPDLVARAWKNPDGIYYVAKESHAAYAAADKLPGAVKGRRSDLLDNGTLVISETEGHCYSVTEDFTVKDLTEAAKILTGLETASAQDWRSLS